MRVALTDRFVASAKSGDEYFDAKLKGLSLVPLQQGSTKTWWFHFTSPDGRRARVKLGTYPSMRLAVARSSALEARALLEAGGDPRAHKAGGMTVAMLVESYIVKHVRPLRNAYQIERRVRKNVVPIIGTVRLADLHRRDINRVIDAILARGRPVEANNVFSDVRAMLRWAVKRGDLDHNPIVGMSLPSPVRFSDRALSEPEVAQLWAALPTALARAVDTQRILKLCLITGQRIGEVAGIIRAELDLSAREWRLPARRSKNKHPHTIPLSGMALGVIGEALADASGERLFGIASKEAGRRVREARDAIGIAHWSPHDLRRSALTLMAKLGVAPVVIGHVANHRTTTKAGVTLGVYVQHSYEEEKRRALDLWAERLQAIVSGKATADVIPIGGERGR
jgi:integrase